MKIWSFFYKLFGGMVINVYLSRVIIKKRIVMKVMVKFEMEVLNNMSYAKLSSMYNNLEHALSIGITLREESRSRGYIIDAATAEASIIRIKENLTLINLVMLSKENDVMESFKLGIEPICLN